MLKKITFYFVLFLIPLRLWAFPNEEKASLAVSSTEPTSLLLVDDREGDTDEKYLFFLDGDDILRVDMETFALTEDQVPTLTDNSDDTDGQDLTGNMTGLAVRGTTLYALQSEGDIIVVDLDDITETPISLSVEDTIDPLLGSASVNLTDLVADQATGTDHNNLYILDRANNALIVYNLSSETSTSILLADELGSSVTPTALLLVSSTNGSEQIYISSDSGLVFVVAVGGTEIAQRVRLSDAIGLNLDLPAMAASPNGDFVFVLNQTDSTIHVLETVGNTEVDTDPLVGGVDPIDLSDDNRDLQGVLAGAVSDPDDTYLFVTGTEGISVVDLNLGIFGSFSTPEILDMSDEGVSDTENDPIELGSTGNQMVLTEDGYLFVANGNATLSLVTDNPFVVISATSLGASSLTTAGSFTMTFQSDETGTYEVFVGGDKTGTGTEVLSGTVDSGDTDVTTDTIEYSASLFSEGSNRLFVFVTDDDGNVGYDAIDVTVDTPPPAMTLRSTSFGTEKVYVTFDRLTISDIHHYNLYADTDPDEVLVKTTVGGTVTQTSSGSTLEGSITGLTNGTEYYIAVEAVDAAGNVGPRVGTLSDGSAATATAERTVGLAEFTGETGCQLSTAKSATSAPSILFLYILSMGGLWLLLRARSVFLIVALMLFIPTVSFAVEKSPQWWSLELKGGIWVPMDSTTKDFVGSCCEPMGKMEFGFLYRSRYAFEIGVGYAGASGTAVGATSGAASQDHFGLTLIPIENSFTYRADYQEDQLFVPYGKVGLDYVLFRESTNGRVTKGIKYGLHSAVGLQILLDHIEDLSHLMEEELGVNDVYLTVEGRYGWVNNFGGSGLDLSNLNVTLGFLFEF